LRRLDGLCHPSDRPQGEAYWLEGLKSFKATDPGFAPGSKYLPTNILFKDLQGFTWSDFSAKPGRSYTYRIRAKRNADEPHVL
jgi:hypothetical protein